MMWWLESCRVGFLLLKLKMYWFVIVGVLLVEMLIW